MDTERGEKRIIVLEMDVLRTSCRKSKRNCVHNERIIGLVGINETIVETIERRQLIWYGHVKRMSTRDNSNKPWNGNLMIGENKGNHENPGVKVFRDLWFKEHQ